MRVVFVASQFLPLVGGAEVNLARLAAMLHAQGHDVEVLTLRRQISWAHHETIDGVPVTRIGGVFARGTLRMGFGLSLAAYARMAQALQPRLRRCDLVYCLGLTPLSACAAWLAGRSGKPVVVRIATTGPAPGTPWSDEKCPQSLLAGPLPADLPLLRIPARTYVGSDLDHLRATSPRLMKPTLAALRQSHVHVIALSTLMRDRLVAAGFAGERIAIIPSGIDAGAFASRANPGEAPSSRPPTVLCVARHSFEKGIDVALQAWRIVREQMPQARLVLLGDGPLRPQLQALAQALDLGDSVAFRGQSREVASALAQADCFVLPSRWEGFPTALLEACAAGVPAVATDVSGVRDLIDDGCSGYVVPVADYQQMAARLLALLIDPARRRQMGAQAAQRVRASFTQQQSIDRLLDLLEQLAAPAWKEALA
jgi:glycosyltransferase involved in cell wall biosynthesis